MLYGKSCPHVVFWMLAICLISCQSRQTDATGTHIRIKGDQWYINGKLTNAGSPAEGLLMNVRMVNAVFEDRGNGWQQQVEGFDPDVNTQHFIEKIPEYVSQGVNAFVISLQGGMPGYEGAVNTAFEPDGSLRPEYLNRVSRVIEAADENGAGIILSCFYQRQRGHEHALDSKASMINAVENTARWIHEQGFGHVLLEISNEYRHGGFRSWPDSEWLISAEGQAELIQKAKAANPELLVSTSGMGEGTYPDILATAADFLLIHFNNTALDEYGTKIQSLKKYGKPIVCNEDNKIGKEGAAALALTVKNGAAYGYMNINLNQSLPFEFHGTADDPEVYDMYKNVTTPGYLLKTASLEQPSITITRPNDGDVFFEGNPVEVHISHIFRDTIGKHTVVFTANGEHVEFDADLKKFTWTPENAGSYLLKVTVYNEHQEELYASAPVDIQVSAKKPD